MVDGLKQTCFSIILSEKAGFSLVFVQRLVKVAVKMGGGETMGSGWVGEEDSELIYLKGRAGTRS